MSPCDYSLSYRPGSQNNKPDVFLDSIQSSEEPGTITWESDRIIKEAQRDQPNPGGRGGHQSFVCFGGGQVSSSAVGTLLKYSNITCHLGANWTLQLLQQHYWWPNMSRVAWEFVAACPICACGKSSHSSLAGQLCYLPIHKRPFSGHQLRQRTTVHLCCLERILQTCGPVVGQMEWSNQNLETTLCCVTALPSLDCVRTQHSHMHCHGSFSVHGYQPPLFHIAYRG